MTIFEKNMSALLAVDPLFAAKILEISENKKYDVYQGKDAAQINLYDKENQITLYEKPIEETLEKVEFINTEYSRYRFFYFYGLGNAIALKMLLTSEHIQRIVVLEPEKEIVYVALNLIDFSEDILSGRVIIALSEDFNFTKGMMIFEHPEGQLFAHLFNLEITLPYYENFYMQDIQRVHDIFLRSIQQVITSHGNDAIDSLMGVEHHVQNLPEMIRNPKFKELATKKNSDIAIVVSTGPSLHKQLPLLKKIAPYVTIISVDASFPILERAGIKPDLVTVLERVPETGKFFKETSAEFQKDVIFVMVSIAHQEVVHGISAGTKVLVMRPHNYTQYYELDDYGYLGLGMSAANMAHELAFVMNFKTCVLIGQDLAFGEDGTSHCSGHLYGDNEETYKESDEFVEKYGGEGTIRTTFYWKVFRNYFEKTITLSQDIMTTINSTEGGCRIPGSVEKTFQEVCDTLVDKSVVKEKIVVPYPTKEEIDNAMAKCESKVKGFYRYAKKLQNRIETLFLEVAETFDTLVELNKQGHLDRIEYDKLLELNAKIDEIKDQFDTHDFKVHFLELSRSLLVHEELNLAKIQVSNSITDEQKKAKLVDWIMNHRYWLFSLAGAINAQRAVVKRAKRRWNKK